MKEALVTAGPIVEIVDSAIPEPNDDQVLIRVVVSGSNPKDWKVPILVPGLGHRMNQGDDIAGVVAKVGSNVTEFKEGDRVAAFHQMMTPHGSYAEYAIAWQHTTFHIPKKTSFEEAAALPLAAATAALGLYMRLGLPQPWSPATEKIPLILYGASTAVGSYALQFAQRSNIHPIIAIAGKSRAHVEGLIDRSKGDTIIDYRGKSIDALTEEISQAAGGLSVHHTYDAISENQSWVAPCKVMAQTGSHITTVLPNQDYTSIPEGIKNRSSNVGSVHEDDKDFGYIIFRYMGRGLQEGWLKPQPQEVVPGGLGGIQQALQNLYEGKANAIKYVFRIADTEGVEST